MDVDTADLTKLPLERLLATRKRLRRTLSAQPGLQPIRIAVLGGSTTEELVDLLELVLLSDGFLPAFYQSGHGRYHVEAVQDPEALLAFQPELVYLHTSLHNLQHVPAPGSTEQDLAAALAAEMDRFRQIWRSIDDRIGCQVLQNNFELPPHPSLGSLDVVLPGGHTRFVTELNLLFAREAASNPRLLIHDLCGLSARFGLDRWFDRERFFAYKIVTTAEATYSCARSLAAMIRALFGRTRKLLVLDLDNTLWGGAVGEVGVEGLQLGHETPVAEAFTAFGHYCLRLRQQGILLAVCSKNDEGTARAAFTHPDAGLKLEHLSAFKANWRPKHENILEIAAELNLTPDTFVFVDDNPAERALVAAQIPGILVPDLPGDVAGFPQAIEAHHPFHQVALSQEDLARAGRYRTHPPRAAASSAFATYGDYLDSLEMRAEVEPFSRLYLQRIAQLVNRTNQFNLTTQRCTPSGLASVLHRPDRLGLYGRLTDRFGDHGLVSALMGTQHGDTFTLDLWVMSCRVLKRDLESAMLDVLVEHLRIRGVRTLIGQYRPTRKNCMVADHYLRLGFSPLSTEPDGSTDFLLDLRTCEPRNRHLRVVASVLATQPLEPVAQ